MTPVSEQKNIGKEIDEAIKKKEQELEEKTRRAYEEYKASGKRISLDELAKKYGVSKSTLSRRFKKYEEEELKSMSPPGIRVSEEELEELTMHRIVEKAKSTNIPSKLKAEFDAKLRKFMSKPKPERDKLVVESLHYFIKLAEVDKIEALRKLIKWLSTPDGIIIMSYVWRPSMREHAMKAISEIILMAYRVE